jgi:hypothetical protein
MSLAASKPGAAKKLKPKVVADSWEDDVEEGSDTEEETKATQPDAAPAAAAAAQKPVPSAPPPTPISPIGMQALGIPDWGDDAASSSGGQSRDPNKRPEKTDVVARRLIAGALGIKAPRLTDEQREYNRVIREQEQKRRERARAEEQKQKVESDKAKAAIWND